MATTIKIKRGGSANLADLALQKGEMAFTTDTKELWIGTSDTPGSKLKYQLNYPTYTIEEMNADFIPSNLIGAVDGVCPLDQDGYIPGEYFPPGYIDEVVTVGVYGSLPSPGISGVLYVVTSESKTYRWTGSSYAAIITWENLTFDGGVF